MVTKITSYLTFMMVALSGFAQGEPLHWKATKGDKELVILGSVHMGKEEMYPLPEVILQSLQSSDALILEADLNSASVSLPKSNELTTDYLTAIQKAELKKISAEVGISEAFLLSQPPWRTALILQLAYYSTLGYQEELGIDNYLANKARQNNIPIKGLETVGYQLSLFSDSAEVGRDLLDDIINEWDKNKKISECLIDDWISGDEDKLESLMHETSNSEEIIDLLIYNRNRNWAEKLDDSNFVSKDGRYLIVVGALHLVGKDNLISLLKDRGFQIEQLSESVKSNCHVD